MTTVIAITVFGLFFTVFALLGPAERSKPCGGRKPGETPCAGCALADPALTGRANGKGVRGTKGSLGAKVVLLDLGAPWEKPCGGGLTPAAFRMIPELEALKSNGRPMDRHGSSSRDALQASQHVPLSAQVGHEEHHAPPQVQRSHRPGSRP